MRMHVTASLARRGAAVVAALIVCAIGVLAAPASAAPRPDGQVSTRATGWYLALGDSLAAGYLHGSGDHPTEGYVGGVLDAVRTDTPKTRLVNLACSGETTTSMVNGGRCAYDEGSQLSQAVEFLHAHHRFTRLVTIDIGGNDIATCGFQGLPPSCVAGGLNTIRTNLPTILGQLRAAAGPDVQIVVLDYYDPFLAFWLLGTPTGQALATGSVDLLTSPTGVNGLIRAAAAATSSDVADVQTAFQTLDFTPIQVPGLGTVPTNVARICLWTTMFTAQDFHPNPTGYSVLAGAVTAVLN